MRSHLVQFSSLVVVIAGCANDPDQPTPNGGVDPLPVTTGHYVGLYRVPTVTPDLEAAATFPIDSADWIISGDTVTLHYDLPIGLVGGDVEVTLTGTFAAGAKSVDVSGPAGTGACTRDANIVTCLETFTGLGTLPVSMEVVERAATAGYAGPTQDRIDVATVFGSDPIGVLEFDLDRPYIESEHEDD
ncbi:MAG: hypothetical protein HOV81_31245 [Kofleriaceae bacterium]|nr:hypothetical protein [Kofleriaceae bacterium]